MVRAEFYKVRRGFRALDCPAKVLNGTWGAAQKADDYEERGGSVMVWSLGPEEPRATDRG